MKAELSKELTLAEIPQGVIDELNEGYQNVVMELDSDITVSTRTFKIKYSETETELSDGAVLISDTLESTTVKGYLKHGWLVHLDVVENTTITAIVRRIMYSGSCIVPEETKV